MAASVIRIVRPIASIPRGGWNRWGLDTATEEPKKDQDHDDEAEDAAKAAAAIVTAPVAIVSAAPTEQQDQNDEYDDQARGSPFEGIPAELSGS
jgi:hypothetical protein